MLIVGLGHKARQGKDEVAAAIKRAYPRLDIRLYSFADPLRAEIHTAAVEEWRERHPRKPFDPRRALKELCQRRGVEFDRNAIPDEANPWGKQRALQQWWGTEFRRAQDPDYWLKQAEMFCNRARAEGGHAVIIRDLRFRNEYDYLGLLGGWRIKISRLGFVSGVPEHVSETELNAAPFDLSLGVGDGHLELLRAMAVFLFAKLLETSAEYNQRTVTFESSDSFR